jgi:predicted nucleic acid-binding protein
MIFVDTGAWFAAVVPTDPDHPAASRWLAGNTQPLLTTDYVIDETLTLLRARGEKTRALLIGEGFFSGRVAEILHAHRGGHCADLGNFPALRR